MIKYFGKQGENTARKVLEPMANLYNELVSKGVLFPAENKFLDYDVDQQATKPSEPKGIRQQPIDAPLKEETEEEFVERYERDIEKVLANRQTASEAILYRRWEDVDASMKAYATSSEAGRKLAADLDAKAKKYPQYADTAEGVHQEMKMFEHIDKAHKKFKKDGKRRSFMLDVLAGYKNIMKEDLTEQVELSEDEVPAPPIDHRGPSNIKSQDSGPAIPIMKSIDDPRDLGSSPIPLPANPTSNKQNKPNKRDPNVRFGGPGIGVIDEVDSFEEKRFDSKPTPAQNPRVAPYEDRDSFDGYQDVAADNQYGKPSGLLRNSSNNYKYQEDQKTSRLEQELRDKIHKQNRDRMEEEYQQSLIDRANRERADRERRNREDDQRMNQRQREIDALLQSTKATSNLISNSTQIENVALYAQLQKAVFELTSLSKRASTLASEIKAANQDFGKQEQRVDRDFITKGKESDRLQDLRDKKSRLQELKELLVRKVDNRKEEIRKLRVETGNAGTAKMDDEVQKDLDRIDRLMEAKGLELKREKQRYEKLRDQYEEHQNQVYERKQKALSDETLNQTRPGTPPKRHTGTAFDLGGSNYVQSSLLRSGIENSGIKGSTYSKASRAMPKIQSELKVTPGSAFLDDFNRDLQRLLFKEDGTS